MRDGARLTRTDAGFTLEGRLIAEHDRLELRLPDDVWASGWAVFRDGELWLSVELGGAWDQERAAWRARFSEPLRTFPEAALELHQDCILRWPTGE